PCSPVWARAGAGTMSVPWGRKGEGLKPNPADTSSAAKNKARRVGWLMVGRVGSCVIVKLRFQPRSTASSGGYWLEGQSEAVHAVAQAGRPRPVVEDMAEMAAAPAAMH